MPPIDTPLTPFPVCQSNAINIAIWECGRWVLSSLRTYERGTDPYAMIFYAVSHCVEHGLMVWGFNDGGLTVYAVHKPVPPPRGY